MFWAAAETASDNFSANSPFVAYLNLGIIVVVLILAYTRKIRFEGEVKEKDAQIKKLEETVEKVLAHYQTEVLPAYIEQTRVGGEVIEVLRDVKSIIQNNRNRPSNR